MKTAAVMRQKDKVRLSRCPVDGKSNVSDATTFAISLPRNRGSIAAALLSSHESHRLTRAARSPPPYSHLKVVSNKAL